MKEFIDKLISRLEEAKESANRRNAFDSEVSYACAIDIVNKLAEEYKVSEMPTGWIPCSERLPDTEHISGVSETVLVTTCGNSIFTAEYHGNGKWLDDVADWSLDVIAWMPLPAPYQQKESYSEIPNNSTRQKNIAERFERVE